MAASKAAPRNAIVYNPASSSYRPLPDEIMLSFLHLLQHRYRAATHYETVSDARVRELQPLLRSLGFAGAFLEKLGWLKAHPRQPVHIAILGPTQAGKSSVVNWLTATQHASVSPLAGYTVHPQGFALTANRDAEDGIGDYFRGYRRVPAGALDPNELDAYSLDQLDLNTGNGLLQGTVLWDTPDFDSIHAGDYQDSVLRVAALADVVVLVVSKDKYADLSVWEFMRLLEPLQQPALIVLNKTEDGSRATLVQSVEAKWRSFRSDAVPRIVPLPYLPNLHELVDMESLRQPLLSAIQSQLGRIQRPRYPEQARRLIQTHWPDWTAPLATEHRLEQAWRDGLAVVVDECLDRYQREYLNNPAHYGTFQKALTELLTLLEVPGIGKAMQNARRLVTAPVRLLTRIGQRVAGREGPENDGEAAMLHQLAEHALVRIGEDLLMRSSTEGIEQRWWNLISQQISRQRGEILIGFDAATRAYTRAFQPEIDKTAHGLYERLQEHPVVLNSLRATRVTTDVAALALAIYAAGIGPVDVAIAPAMLSVTTLLTESALGRYMHKSAEQLKTRQRTAVEQLFRTALLERLGSVTDQLDPATRLGISVEALELAATQLR